MKARTRFGPQWPRPMKLIVVIFGCFIWSRPPALADFASLRWPVPPAADLAPLTYSPLTYSLFGRPLRSQSQPEQHHRSQNIPPADDRLHLRDAELFRWINLRAGDFSMPVAANDHLVEQVHFQPVAVEPFLIQSNARIVEAGEPD